MGRPPLLVVLATGLVVGVLVRGWWAAPVVSQPPRVPLADAQPWMLDALPGIGPQRRLAATRSVIHGDLHAVPVKPQSLLSEVFLCPVP